MTDAAPRPVGISVSLLDQSLDILARCATPLDVARPVADVYGYLADFLRHVEWAHTYVSVEALAPPPVVVGSRFRVVEKQDLRWDKLAYHTIAGRDGVDHSSEIEVRALVPELRVAWRTVNRSQPFGGEWEFVLEPIDAANTKVRMAGNLAASSDDLVRFMMDLRAKALPLDVIQRQTDRGMHNIRTILEGRARR
ncbi:MAG: hypothetical protein HW416_439 [Chloroflexi bacterium]|nr:hypothetical protein [Chloroflexota bacterium]